MSFIVFLRGNNQLSYMKSVTLFCISALFLGVLACDHNPIENEPLPLLVTEEASNPGIVYDSVLAKKFGADEYGKHKFVIAFLKRGPNRETDSVKSKELMKAHLANIDRMAEAGTLVLAGPFFDDGDLRGLYFFNVSTIDEARELTQTDPAIQSGHLIMELKEWYGSAAVVGINEVHQTLMKKSVLEI